MKPTAQQIKKFKKDYGQTHEEICFHLDFDFTDEGSGEAIINTGNYFWSEEDKLWLNSYSSFFSEEEQKISDYLKNN